MTDAGGPPRRLGQRYELGDVLGLGGMAEVRRGHDVRLGRDVAVKSLRADLARDPAFQGRFRREAQAAASLNHPTIVAIYDTGDDVDGGTPYIVMEYVDGRTLRDVLRTDGRLSAGRALELTREVLRALDYSHRGGIVHRDIKPANVMLTRSGTVKVMDFGISRALSDSTSAMTQTAGVMGTAQYLSPEQARGEHVDHRSDIYSTGCMLYELLTGQPPFTGDSPVSVAYQHVREDPVPPSQLVPDLPESVDAIVLKAMAKNPANRYQAASEMREDVERALAGQPVRATPVLTRPAYPSTMATTVLRSTMDEDEERRNGQRAAAYVALGVGVILVFLLAAFLVRAALDGGSDGSVATPALSALTLQQASVRLAQDGLEVGEVREEFNTEFPAGQVIKSEPLSGISVRAGDAVDLFVSRGPPPVAVPDVRGDSRKDAEAAILAAKLKIGTVTTADGPREAGTVLEVNPAPGTQVRQGSAVSLVVASGKNAVPDVRGRSVGEAQGLLTEAGFKVQVQEVVDESAAAGTVLGQDPQPGTVARVQSVIRIVVATAQPRPTPEPTVEPTPTPEPTQTIEPFPPP